MARWENEDPLVALDAQIRVIEVARADCFAALIEAEQDVIAAIVRRDPSRETDARRRATDARNGARDFSAELDDLRTERALLVPPQRWPSASS